MNNENKSVQQLGKEKASISSKKPKGRYIAAGVVVVSTALFGIAHRSDSDSSTTTTKLSTEVDSDLQSINAETMRIVTKEGQFVYNAAIDGELVCDPNIDDCSTLPDDTETYEVQPGDIAFSGVVAVRPEKNDGLRNIVLTEATQSNVELTEAQLDSLVYVVEGLNIDQYGNTKQPVLGQDILVPNIIGPNGIDKTPID